MWGGGERERERIGSRRWEKTNIYQVPTKYQLLQSVTVITVNFYQPLKKITLFVYFSQSNTNAGEKVCLYANNQLQFWPF